MRTIIQNIHLKVYNLRMIIVILLLLIWGISNAWAKKTNLLVGAEVKINFANQIVYNPLNMESENYKWDNLNCIGAAALLEMQKSKHWSFTGKLGYNQKGFIQASETAIRVDNGTTVKAPFNAESRNKNIFHYATLDALAKYSLGKKIVVPFLETGISFNYLVAKNIGSNDLFQLSGNQFYDYKFYKKTALGLLAGIGATFDKKISLIFETNIDLTKSVNTSNLAVQNWCYSIVLGFNINQLFAIH